jgi:hypothetical protein
MAIDREQLLEFVIALGCEFSRRGMADHCARLRLYYLALRHGLDSARHRVEVHWDEELVLEWMRLLRLPPFRDHYPVRDTTGCERCESRPGTVVTKGVFPGGAKLECTQCGAQWLMRHRGAPTR